MGSPARRGLLSCAFALVATPGCAQLAGIDETSGLVPPDRVSLQVERVSVGATVVRAPQDLSANTASFLVADATVPEGFTRVPAELTDVNLWSAEVPDGTPAIEFTLPDVPTPQRRVWQLPNRNMMGQFGVYEHPSPQPAPPNATLNVMATLPSAYVSGQSFQFASIGTWNFRTFPAAELPAVDMGLTTLGPVAFAHNTSTKLRGREHEKITSADAVLILRYTGARLTGVMEAAPFEQTGDDMITGTMTNVPAAEMLTADLKPSTVAARYAPLRPAMPSIGMSWQVAAAPGIDHALPGGVSLINGSVTAADPPLSVAYGNPFVSKGWRSLMLWNTTATRSVTPAGQMLPMTLRAELYTFTEPTANMTMSLPAGLPELITMNGVALSSDNLTVPQPVAQATVTFVANGESTVNAVQLYELVPNAAGTALDYKFVIEAVSPTKELLLPADAFAPGKYYTLRAVTHAGSFPNTADGDLATRSFPLSVGYHDSGVFTVTP